MVQSFDDILKNGKDAVVKIDPDEAWKNCIGYILRYIQYFNEMYDDKSNHNLSLKEANCDKCKKATYIALVNKLNATEESFFKFNLGDWAISEDKTILCPNCKDQ